MSSTPRPTAPKLTRLYDAARRLAAVKVQRDYWRAAAKKLEAMRDRMRRSRPDDKPSE